MAHPTGVSKGCGVLQAHASRICCTAQHQVATGAQAHPRISRNQYQIAGGTAQGRFERIVCTDFARILIQGKRTVLQIDAAHGTGIDLRSATQVDHRALQIMARRLRSGFSRPGLQRGVERTAETHVDIATTGQLQAAIAAHSPGAAHGDDQALATRIKITATITDRVKHATVCASAQADVTAAKSAETRKTHQIRRGTPARIRQRLTGIAAEVDPPGGRYFVVPRTLTPQPVANGNAWHLLWGFHRDTGRTSPDDIAGNRTAGANREVTPSCGYQA